MNRWRAVPSYVVSGGGYRVEVTIYHDYSVELEVIHKRPLLVPNTNTKIIFFKTDGRIDVDGHYSDGMRSNIIKLDPKLFGDFSDLGKAKEAVLEVLSAVQQRLTDPKGTRSMLRATENVRNGVLDNISGIRRHPQIPE